MAEIVGIFGVSHTPVMTNMPDAPGAAIRDAVFEAFRRVGKEIAALTPDILLLVSNDHLHNFFIDNLPAFCIGAGDSYDSPLEGWLKVNRREVPGHAAFGAHLIESAFDAGFDPAFSMELILDHAMVTPLELAGVAGAFPIVPIYVNCVQPPLPRMKRCFEFGRALRDGIERYSGARRVAMLATGGLSHDVGTPRMGCINEDFDRRFLRLLDDGDPDKLARFLQVEVNTAGNGAEEVRNWLVAHGAAANCQFELYHYQPVPEWYTGIGVGQWTRR
ncbi:MAG TPA: hypothetical protein VJQ47_18235 [Steroidobacteraceae bacterium]|nr:hypothetical protein [Steroidobacteraceae bacterium]